MRYLFIVLCTLFLSGISAFAQLSIGIGLPSLNIGISVPAYPNLVPVPGYPVYYAPGMNSNFFFYDGMYWVYQGDNWYASTWYNGPWGLVSPEAVPLFVLRVPVRYYREPPAYFRGWSADAPPQWGEHWGNGWAQQHSGWDKWNRASAPRAAPLPAYQKQYSGNKYPGAAQQQALHSQNYRYQPKDAVVKQHYQTQAAPQENNPKPQNAQRSKPEPTVQQKTPAAAPREQAPQKGFENAQRPAPMQGRPQEARPPAQQQTQAPQKGFENAQRPAPAQARPQEKPPVQQQSHQPQPGPAQHEQPAPRPAQDKPAQVKSAPQAPREEKREEPREERK